MKKFLGTISAVIIVTLLFAGCAGNNGANNQNGASNAGNQDEPWKDAEGGQIAVGIATNILLDGTEVKYIHVSGHPDPAVEKDLNGELYAFSAWDLEDMKDIKLEFTVTGARQFLSIRRSGTRHTEGAAYPVAFLETQIFELDSGEQAGDIKEFIKVDNDFRKLITSGVFKQVYPEGVEAEGAAERLAAEIVDKMSPDYFDLRFYLTDTSLGLYIEVLHAEGDYWAFEAPYTAITKSMQKKLALEYNLYQ